MEKKKFPESQFDEQEYYLEDSKRLHDKLKKMVVDSEEEIAKKSDGEYKKGVTQWNVMGRQFNPMGEIKLTKKLHGGWYRLAHNGRQYVLELMEIRNDELINLPMPEYAAVLEDMKRFWASKDKYRKHNFPHKRGIILYGRPGCHAKGTKILMHDGTTKNVEDVKVGDLLMGDDSTPRKVLSLARGEEEMVRVHPLKGDSYVVNMGHIMSLVYSSTNEVRNVTVRDYLNFGVKDKERLKLYRVGVDYNKKTLKIDPYIFGVWLGDGSCDSPELTSMDDEIIKEWGQFGLGRCLTVEESRKPGAVASSFYLSGVKGKENSVTADLRDYNVYKNKHIPLDYLTSSRSDRLELLAGLIDTGGSVDQNCYEVTTVIPALRDGIVQLCRSLGFFVSWKTSPAGSFIQGGNEINYKESYRVIISGDLSVVPVRLERKKATPRKQVKNVLRTGFGLERLGVDEYFGFELDGNHLYLTEDFMVHHNTGKSGLLRLLGDELINNQDGVLFNIGSPDDIYAFESVFSAFREVEPERQAICILEDVDNFMRYGGSTQAKLLNILDGNMHYDGIVFLATTNFPQVLLESISNRPSRFDRRYEIGTPNEEARRVYISTKFKELSNEEVDRVSKVTEGFSIDQLKETILSIYVLGYPFAETIEEMKKLFVYNGKVGDDMNRFRGDGEEYEKGAKGMKEIDDARTEFNNELNR